MNSAAKYYKDSAICDDIQVDIVDKDVALMSKEDAMNFSFVKEDQENNQPTANMGGDESY